MKRFKGKLSLLLMFLSLYSTADTVRLPCAWTPLSEDKLRSNLWDLTGCNLVAEDTKAWVSVSPTGFVTEYDSPDATHYLVRGDSLLFRGYTRGNDIAAIADILCHTLRLPLAGGYGTTSRYRLDGYYSGRRTFLETGICETTVTGEGNLIFAPGDTLRTVLVHEVHSNIADSTGSGESAAFRREYWRWYTPGSMLPVAVQAISREEDTSRLLTINHEDYIFEHEDDAPVMTTDTDRIVNEATVSVSGGHVSVTLSGHGRVAAEVSLVDPRGNLYGHASGTGEAEGLTLRIDTKGMPPGFYMTVISVHDPNSGSKPSIEKRMISI